MGTDLFTIEGRNYLITYDYFSQFFEIDYLKETNSEEVISKLKHHFARHGIPERVISDNGPQYSSHQFKMFAKSWNFSHETSSPGNSKSNGAAEAAVKIAKSLMKKCRVSREDPYIGLLNIRNTPQEGMTSSPAQRLMGRRTRTLMPTFVDRLKPRNINIENDRKKMEDKRSKIADRHLNRRTLTPLHVGDTVRMQPIDDKNQRWKSATVTKELKRRSYEVTTDEGKSYRRNRQFLRKSVASQPQSQYPFIETPETCENANNDSDKENSSNTIIVPDATLDGLPDQNLIQTRSGRVLKKPVRLDL